MSQASNPPLSNGVRTSWQVTRSVWYAMFMREAISRTMADRMGWFWMIAEPMAFTLIMLLPRSFAGGDALVANAEFIPWMITGMMGYFLVRDGMLRSMGAVDANSALFAYRQVQPVDPVLVRNAVEGVLHTFIFLLFILGALFFNIDLVPDNAIAAIGWWIVLWCVGVALGLIASVAGTLVPELATVFRMSTMPLMILSGVILPLNHLPHTVLEYLMYNPLVHGVELLRAGFFDGYKVVHGTSAIYFGLFTLATLALGLVMHVRFKEKLKTQ